MSASPSAPEVCKLWSVQAFLWVSVLQAYNALQIIQLASWPWPNSAWDAKGPEKLMEWSGRWDHMSAAVVILLRRSSTRQRRAVLVWLRRTQLSPHVVSSQVRLDGHAWRQGERGSASMTDSRLGRPTICVSLGSFSAKEILQNREWMRMYLMGTIPYCEERYGGKHMKGCVFINYWD